MTPPPTVPPGQPGAYELFCPGTPVGNIALNNVSTTASIPSGLSTGQQFEATNFQTNLNLPSSIVSAAAALGNSAITGDAVVKVDATGANPATVSSGDLAINVPIPSPVPTSGLACTLETTVNLDPLAAPEFTPFTVAMLAAVCAGPEIAVNATGFVFTEIGVAGCSVPLPVP